LPTPVKGQAHGFLTVFRDFTAADGKVLHATLNRPETLNAVDETMETELGRLFATSHRIRAPTCWF